MFLGWCVSIILFYDIMSRTRPGAPSVGVLLDTLVWPQFRPCVVCVLTNWWFCPPQTKRLKRNAEIYPTTFLYLFDDECYFHVFLKGQHLDTARVLWLSTTTVLMYATPGFHERGVVVSKGLHSNTAQVLCDWTIVILNYAMPGFGVFGFLFCFVFARRQRQMAPPPPRPKTETAKQKMGVGRARPKRRRMQKSLTRPWTATGARGKATLPHHVRRSRVRRVRRRKRPRSRKKRMVHFRGDCMGAGVRWGAPTCKMTRAGVVLIGFDLFFHISLPVLCYIARGGAREGSSLQNIYGRSCATVVVFDIFSLFFAGMVFIDCENSLPRYFLFMLYCRISQIRTALFVLRFGCVFLYHCGRKHRPYFKPGSNPANTASTSK